MYITAKDYYLKGSVSKKSISGRESQGAWRQDELTGGKPQGRKETLTLTFDISGKLRILKRSIFYILKDLLLHGKSDLGTLIKFYLRYV
jgi:hypothetical protein